MAKGKTQKSGQSAEPRLQTTPESYGHYYIHSVRPPLDLMIGYNGAVMSLRVFLEKACKLKELNAQEFQKLSSSLLE